MITTVCLNPAIDRTVSVPSLVPGGLNRVASSRQDAGGKGVNVAVALSRLGEEAACVALLPREGGRLIEEKLSCEGIRLYAVRQAGAVRTNLKILDESKAEITEINENGPAVGESELDEIRALILERCHDSKLIVLSGSTPPGCDAAFYRGLMEAIHHAGCRCALDADAGRLKKGIGGRPDFIKPNLHELQELTGRRIAGLADVNDAAKSLIDLGIGMVAVSMGAEGAYMTDGKTALFAPAVRVQARSTVGAGDAMVAGMAAGIARGMTLEETMRLSVACAASSVMSDGTGMIDAETVKDLMNRVVITKAG